jgi:ribosomal peptide maturation radical SAM protein 1
VVDNILDMKYFKTLIPALAQKNDGRYDLFYEVKANLRQEQVAMLKMAGINTIQPGIESLSDNVLKLMRKGVKAIQNIQLLKWCEEYGIKAEWNILWGFPGEQPADYEKMAGILPLIVHFKPPHGASPIRLDRFSPNFITPEALGFKDIAPYPSYAFIYPFDSSAIFNLAYYFIYQYKEKQEVNSYTRHAKEEIIKWKSQHYGSALFTVDKGDLLLIWDFRPVAERHLITLTGLERSIYLFCDRIRTLDEIFEFCSSNNFLTGRSEITKILSKLIHAKICIKDEMHFLNLSVRLNENYSPDALVLKKLNQYIKNIGNYDGNGHSTIICNVVDRFGVQDQPIQVQSANN